MRRELGAEPEPTQEGAHLVPPPVCLEDSPRPMNTRDGRRRTRSAARGTAFGIAYGWLLVGVEIAFAVINLAAFNLWPDQYEVDDPTRRCVVSALVSTA